VKYLYIIILAAIFASVQAHAQDKFCSTEVQTVEQYLGTFDQYQIWHGLGVNELTIKLYQDDDNGDWTVTVQGGDLPECTYGSGIAGVKVPRPRPGVLEAEDIDT